MTEAESVPQDARSDRDRVLAYVNDCNEGVSCISASIGTGIKRSAVESILKGLVEEHAINSAWSTKGGYCMYYPFPEPRKEKEVSPLPQKDRLAGYERMIEAGEISTSDPVADRAAPDRFPPEEKTNRCQYCGEVKEKYLWQHELRCKDNPNRKLPPGVAAKKSKEQQFSEGVPSDAPAAVVTDCMHNIKEEPSIENNSGSRINAPSIKEEPVDQPPEPQPEEPAPIDENTGPILEESCATCVRSDCETSARTDTLCEDYEAMPLAEGGIVTQPTLALLGESIPSDAPVLVPPTVKGPVFHVTIDMKEDPEKAAERMRALYRNKGSMVISVCWALGIMGKPEETIQKTEPVDAPKEEPVVMDSEPITIQKPADPLAAFAQQHRVRVGREISRLKKVEKKLRRRAAAAEAMAERVKAARKTKERELRRFEKELAEVGA